MSIHPGTFIVEIEPGELADRREVAASLVDLADHLANSAPDEWEGSGPMRAADNSTVGRWTFHDHN